MTNQKAIDNLKFMKSELKGVHVGIVKKKTIDMAIEALEKQIPKKVINITRVKFDGSIRPVFETGKCPSCGEYVNNDDNMYSCDRKSCNQMLDWSEEA